MRDVSKMTLEQKIGQLICVRWYNTKEDFRILEKAIKYIELLPTKVIEKTEEFSVGDNICRKTPREAFNSKKENLTEKLLNEFFLP